MNYNYNHITKNKIINKKSIRKFSKYSLISKYLFLFIFYIYFISYNIKKSSILVLLKNHSININNYSDLNVITEINNYKDTQLYINNQTDFFIRKRTQYLQKHNIIYNESNLITFQDKINWLNIHESPKYKSNIVDKIKLREYSKRILGKDICVPILKIYNGIKNIDFKELPDKFILKLNHGSGMNVICNDKLKLNIPKTMKTLNKWKKINYGLKNAEFQYMYVPRKIFAEKFLSDNLIDYQIFCFNGEPKFIQTRRVLKDKNYTSIHNYYNINWELLDLESDLKGYIRAPNLKVERPKYLNLMLKYAKLLSQEFVFVRVDLFEFNNRIYLVELTFTPNNSLLKWKNKTDCITNGNLINITKIKNYLYNK